MGALVMASMFLLGLTNQAKPFPMTMYYQPEVPQHSASSIYNENVLAAATNYQIPYNQPSHQRYEEYSTEHQSNELQNREQLLNDLHTYTDYKTSNSFNIAGPHQLETINTKSYHKEVEPFDVSNYPQKHEEDDAEVHYHQHTHVHKHSHKQDHVHNHKQQHKHQHAHQHQHRGHHDHKHKAEHKHQHHGQHGHHHSHHQEHKHDHHHGHKHSHHSHHKHKHHEDHKHHHGHHHQSSHHHGHGHYNH